MEDDDRPDASARRPSGAAKPGRPRTGVRERVLAAAEAVLAESGIARLSTRRIADRAGVAESSIFYHFGDRLGLLQAVITMRLPQYTTAARDLARRAGRSTVRANLEALLETLETFYLDIMPTVVAIQADAVLRSAFIERTRNADFGPHRALIPVVDYLTAEQALGRVRDTADLRAIALIIIGVAHQRAVQRYVGTPEERLPADVSVVDTLLTLLIPAPSPENPPPPPPERS
ncbi:TetR/AcrR family transcriptional regulator [Glycomyces xiaoerkulensis]|uniref:TetR/AcrR family transcriptional regulator n=1 Tax=Glycomyces xiaoerkulensis TaxID=2038139 RepID=UPI000C25C012|nr:TetR/AcrR family transcriptional regulator [Glycomyces xiaoerkulensis]